MKKKVLLFLVTSVLMLFSMTLCVYASENNEPRISNVSFEKQEGKVEKGGLLSAASYGWNKKNGKWYFNDPYQGILKKGVYYIYADDAYYAFWADGSLVTGGWKRIDILDENNKYTKEWVFASGGGKLLSGWQKLNGKWYYFDESEAPTAYCDGGFYINDKCYYFDSSCAMKTGWLKPKTKWYYADQSGALTAGWKRISGKWYYFDPYDYYMYADESAYIDDRTYYFSSGGAMRTGWIKDGENWFFANTSGKLVTGWQKIRDKWYYFDKSEYYPYMYADEISEINGEHYYFNSSGAMRTGWIIWEGDWYYADSSGALVRGWRTINNKKYYFDENIWGYPYMYADGVYDIGGNEYQFDGNGALIGF